MASNLIISTPSSTIASVMDRAVDIYYTQLPPKDRKKYSLGMQPRTSLADFIVSVSSAQRTSRASTSGAVGEKVSNVLTRLDRFTKIVDSFISAAPDTTALVWGAMKMLMTVAMNKIETADRLLTTMMDVIDAFGICEEYLSVLSSPRLSNAAATMYANMLNILVRMRKHYEKQGVAKFFSGMITPFDVSFGPFVEAFKRSKENVRSEFALAAVSEQTKEFKKQEEFREEVRQDRDRKELRDWLRPVDCEGDYRRINTSRLKGTCKWLLEKPEYEEFRKSIDPDVLWAYGKPGSGKTVLSSFVVNDILTELASAPPPPADPAAGTGNAVVLYFFCNNRSEDRRSAMAILRSISYQLVMQRPDAADPMEKLRKSSGSTSAEVLDDLWTAFEECLRKLNGSPVHLVIDALDECTGNIEERTSLLKYLCNCEYMRSFLVSRNEREIRRIIASPSSTKPSMAITEDDVRQDINFYVEHLVENSPELSSLKIAKSIISRVQEWAKGMFVWAKLVIRDLENTSTPAEIEESLTKGIPEELEDLYKKILQNTSGKNKSAKVLAQFIFAWTTAAYVPLTLEALAEVYQVVEGSDELDEMKKPHTLEAFQRQIEGACGPLVEIRDDGYVLLAHHTTKEFLIQNNIAGESYEEVHALLCRTCLNYLSLSAFDGPLLNLKRFEIAQVDLVRPAHPFLEYAAVHWSAHFGCGGGTADLGKKIDDFLVSKNMTTWMESVITFQSGLEHLGIMAEDIGQHANFIEAIFNWETVLRSYPSEIHYCDVGIIGDKRNLRRNKRMQSLVGLFTSAGSIGGLLKNGHPAVKRFTIRGGNQFRYHIAGNKTYLWGQGSWGYMSPVTAVNWYTSRALPDIPKVMLADRILNQVVPAPDKHSVALVWFGRRGYGKWPRSSTIVTAVFPPRDWPSKPKLTPAQEKEFGPISKAIVDIYTSTNTYEPPQSRMWRSGGLMMLEQDWEDGYFGEAFRGSYGTVAFSADGKILHCPGGTYDLETGKKSKSLFDNVEGHSGTVSPGGRTIAFVHNDNKTVEARDVKRRSSSTVTIGENGARVANISPSGKLVVIVSWNHLYVLHTESGTLHKLGYTDGFVKAIKGGEEGEDEDGPDPLTWEDDGHSRLISIKPVFNLDETMLAAMLWVRDGHFAIHVWKLDSLEDQPPTPFFCKMALPRAGNFGFELQWDGTTQDLLYVSGYSGKITALYIDRPGTEYWDSGSHVILKWKCRIPDPHQPSGDKAKAHFLSVPILTLRDSNMLPGTLYGLTGNVLATGTFEKEAEEDLQIGSHISDIAELWNPEFGTDQLIANRLYSVDFNGKTITEASPSVRFKLPEEYTKKNFGIYYTVLSPDGKYAYYLATITDIKENDEDPDPVQYAVQLIYRCSDGEVLFKKKRHMSNSAEVSGSPVFHPTRPLLAWNFEQYLSDDNKAPDRGIYVIDIEKATETRISDDSTPFDKIYFSPTGKYIVGYRTASVTPGSRSSREPMDSWKISITTFSVDDSYKNIKSVSALNTIGFNRFLTYHPEDNDDDPIKIYGIYHGMLRRGTITEDGKFKVSVVGSLPVRFHEMSTLGMAFEEGRKRMVVLEETNGDEVYCFTLGADEMAL